MDNFSIDQIQRNMALRLASESRMDKTIEVMTIIQSLAPDNKGRITKEAIILEGHHNGLNETEIENTLDELARNRTIQMNDGFIIF